MRKQRTNSKTTDLQRHDTLLERTLNSPKLFYGLLGLLCSCYITFAAIEHVGAKKQQEVGTPISLSMPFDAKPDEPKAQESEYGGLFYVRDKVLRADEDKKDDPATKEAVKEDKLSSEDQEEIQAGTGENPAFDDLLKEASVVIPATDPGDETGSSGVSAQFTRMNGLGSSGGGFSGGGGGSGGGGTSASASAAAPQLAAMGPAPGMPAGAAGIRQVTAVQPGTHLGGARKTTSGVRGAQDLPKGAITGGQSSTTETLAETADSPIAPASAATDGSIGAAPQMESQKKSKAPSAKSGGGGGGGGGGSKPVNEGAQGVGVGSGSGNCKMVPTTEGQIEVCSAGTAGDIGFYGEDAKGQGRIDGYVDYIDKSPNKDLLTASDENAEKLEYFKEKSFLEREVEHEAAKTEGWRKFIGGGLEFLKEKVAPLPPFNILGAAAGGVVKLIDGAIDLVFNRDPIKQWKPLGNLFSGIYDYFTKDEIVKKPQPELNIDIVYEYRREMFEEFIGKTAAQKKAIYERYVQKFVGEYREKHKKKLDEWYMQQADEIREKERKNPYYDKTQDVEKLLTAYQQDKTTIESWDTNAVTKEFGRKLLPSVPADSTLLSSWAIEGKKCPVGTYPVIADYEVKTGCKRYQSEPLIGRFLAFQDEQKNLKELAGEYNDVNKSALAKGVDFLKGAGLFVGAVLTANPVTDALFRMGESIVSKFTGNDQTAKSDTPELQTLPSAPLTGEAPLSVPETNKDEGCGFLWLGCVKKAVTNLFTGGKQEGSTPSCREGTFLTHVGGAWRCVSPPQESAPPVVDEPLPQPEPMRVTNTYPQLPTTQAPAKPVTIYGMPAQPGAGVSDTPAQATAALIGENGERYNVENCPAGTRRFIDLRDNSRQCVIVPEGAKIFVWTGAGEVPWVPVRKCPAKCGTVFIDIGHPAWVCSPPKGKSSDFCFTN
ncbi:MAG: hypothetical protein ABIJ96_16965 [Elusimicrobiota bacterium]